MSTTEPIGTPSGWTNSKPACWSRLRNQATAADFTYRWSALLTPRARRPHRCGCPSGPGRWEKWRTWSDDTTHAIHESRTLRIERVHETPAHETAWTVAAYETPVSDRMWVITATGATPAPVLEELLNHLADADSWDTAIGTPVDENVVTAATQPLSDAGWKHPVDGRWIRWTSPAGDAGVQFDAFTA
ncbi:DUF317 domain-containing protein [Streptomyces sp. NPDC058683]|uniref:DUF317 domain-containing protein n=1 Tax=Streptomyces sp. NPDC058683 TaxID=3346597 RepID=UPI00365FF683